MAKINKVMVGEALVGDGNEVAHIDLIIGPRGSPAETAFCNGLVNNKHGFTSLLAVIAPNLPCKPNTLMFNKVTINDARQAVQMFGPAQHGVAPRPLGAIRVEPDAERTRQLILPEDLGGGRDESPRLRDVGIADLGAYGRVDQFPDAARDRRREVGPVREFLRIDVLLDVSAHGLI